MAEICFYDIRIPEKWCYMLREDTIFYLIIGGQFQALTFVDITSAKCSPTTNLKGHA